MGIWLLMLGIYIFVATIMAVPVGMLILPFFLVFRTMFVWPWMRQGLLRKAIEKGNVVTARFVKSTGYMLQGESAAHPAGSVSGKYEYEYQGKKYSKQLTARRDSDLVREVELYFVRNPKRASVANEIGLSEPNWLVCCLVSAGIAWVAIMILCLVYVNSMIL